MQSIDAIVKMPPPTRRSRSVDAVAAGASDHAGTSQD